MTDKLNRYQKSLDYSYTPGAFATIELLKNRPELAKSVFVHPDYRDIAGLRSLCGEINVTLYCSGRAFDSLGRKENTLALGIFGKYTDSLEPRAPHVVLVNPSDMGNLGTIIRTMAGLNLRDLAVIRPAADIFDPKTVRASMGALFHVRHEFFESFDDYRAMYPAHALFPFMLRGERAPESVSPCPLFSLVFGNEARGLDDRFLCLGQSIRIPLSGRADSFNLAVAVGIGSYVFAVKNGLLD